MRIISKKRDYYDSGAAYGVDMNTVYHRVPQLVNKDHPLKDALKNFWVHMGSSSYGVAIRLGTDKMYHRYRSVRRDDIFAYVAGKKYWGIRLTREAHSSCGESVNVWSIDTMISTLKSWIVDEYVDDEFVKEVYSTEFGGIGFSQATRDLFLKYKIVSLTPAWEYAGGRASPMINSDSLGELGLSKIVDPITMFSQIDQWISMMNDTTRNMVEVSDAVKLTKHGMDHTSFRKPKSK